MSNILVVGNGPLPQAGAVPVGAPALRTWQFCRPLADTHHNIQLIALPAEGKAQETSAREESIQAVHEGFSYTQLRSGQFEFALETLDRALQTLDPDCIVAVNAYPAYLASHLRTRKPLWIDLAGAAIPSGQANAQLRNDDVNLERAWRHEHAALLRADKISAATMPQLNLLLGEMASVGRLNRLTTRYHFVHHIPPSFHQMFTRPPASGFAPLRGEDIPLDACMILWSGSFHSGADTGVLFSGLEKAMAANPKIHFLATGGQIDGYDEVTFKRFSEAVKASPNANRFHLLGWVDIERLPAIYRECDIGLNVDGMNYETMFGGRFRLVNQMAAGLPVATTLGTEISHILQEEQIGLTFPAGDPDALAKTLLDAAAKPQALRAMGQKGRSYVTRSLEASNLARPLKDWADNPRLAPDNAEKNRLMPQGAAFQEFAINEIQQTNLRMAGVDLRELFQARVELEQIRSRWWYRAARLFQDKVLDKLRKPRAPRRPGQTQ